VTKKKQVKSALKEKLGAQQLQPVNILVAEKFKKNRKKSHSTSELIEGVLQGNKTSLSRAITLIESAASKHQSQARDIIEACLPYSNQSIRIGITGVPGVGKSTFIEQFGMLLVQDKHKVAVLAIDPTSTVSKGSILGDKTRMEELVKEPNAFIRPTASGESPGGVARKTREAIILCEAAGFTIIIIETVGVGQSETVVHSMTDFFLLLKLSGAGDELQGIKRGIIEMADAIVINKADGENVKAAKYAQAEFNRALHYYPIKESNWTPKTLVCSALNNKGITEIWKLVSKYISETRKNNYFEKKRKEQNNFWLLQTLESSIKSNFYNNPTIQKELKKQLKLLNENKTTPFEAANYLLGLYTQRLKLE